MNTDKKSIEQAPANEKRKALDKILAQLEHTFGKGAVMRLGENPKIVMDTIPTGSIGLDLSLGVGGVPKGRVVEIYGPESSGKTTLAF
jgi:recombination protein RecA